MKKVLIVDDEEAIRDLIKMNLDLAGYECVTAIDGNEAITVFDESKPDLGLLDIMLPYKDGYELAPYFIDKGVPVIFLSAKANANSFVSISIFCSSVVIILLSKTFFPKGSFK